MKTICISIFCCLGIFVHSQFQSANWFFGKNAGVSFISGNPITLSNGQIDTFEGCASISDENGQLLFYTDGKSVYTKMHQPMPNASANLGTPLFGHSSSSQSAIIVPFVNDDTKYYIFTVDCIDGQGQLDGMDAFNNMKGVNYSVVDVTLNSGLGDVISSEKNINILPKASEKLTACKHRTEDAYWVISHFEGSFYAFKVDATGVHESVVSTLGSVQVKENYPVSNNARGCLKVSPNGRKLAIAHYVDNANSTGILELYDFDSDTGIVSNPIILNNTESPYGIEFSSNNKLLYTSINSNSSSGSNGRIVQYDVSATNIPTTETTIFNVNNSQWGARSSLQMALDGKIYCSFYNRNFLSTIQSPNNVGIACNFTENNVFLGSNGSTTLGLPPFIQSFFDNIIVARNLCFGDTTEFSVIAQETPLSIVWNFGDGNSATGLVVNHTYSAVGTYIVTATVTFESETNVITREVTIENIPQINHVIFSQCDEDNDGLAEFYIPHVQERVIVNAPLYNVTFHETLNDAIQNINRLPELYTNTIPNQVIFARVQSNSGCINYANVTLTTNTTVQDIGEIIRCDEDFDGSTTFDLTATNQLLQATYGTNAVIRWYRNLSDVYLLFGTENFLTSNSITTSNTTIYGRISVQNNCDAVVKLDLLVKPLPKVTYEDELLCPEFGNMLDAGSGYTQYLWSTGETTQTIHITQEGTYSVTLETEFGCTYTNPYRVITPTRIYEVLTEGEGATVHITRSGTYFYSLDLEHWQSSNVFPNLINGTYTVYLRDENDCLLDSKPFEIFYIPNTITPNGDGINDVFRITGLKSYGKNTVTIFDRYGKTVVQQHNSETFEWNGTYLGRKLPSDSYWVVVELASGKKYTQWLVIKNRNE